MDHTVTAAIEHASEMGAVVHQVYRHALYGYAASMTSRAAAALADEPHVQSVQQDRWVRATAQSVPTGVDRVDADLSPTAVINGVDKRVDADVAVIDTGIDLDHPDLNVYRAGGKNCWAQRSSGYTTPHARKPAQNTVASTGTGSRRRSWW